jgi:hypothetical protein
VNALLVSRELGTARRALAQTLEQAPEQSLGAFRQSIVHPEAFLARTDEPREPQEGEVTRDRRLGGRDAVDEVADAPLSPAEQIQEA